jgi:hypothetical protein
MVHVARDPERHFIPFFDHLHPIPDVPQRRIVYTSLDVRFVDVVTTFMFAMMSACVYIRGQQCNNLHMHEVNCDVLTMPGAPYTRQAYQAPRHVWN